MTVDEAIQHCYDVANKLCDECGEEHLQLAKWLEELKRMKQENTKLKRLLKLAVEDMKCNQFVCNLCKHSRSACLKHEKNFECFEWRYADNVKGMIEDGNEMDSSF